MISFSFFFVDFFFQPINVHEPTGRKLTRLKSGKKPLINYKKKNIYIVISSRKKKSQIVALRSNVLSFTELINFFLLNKCLFRMNPMGRIDANKSNTNGISFYFSISFFVNDFILSFMTKCYNLKFIPNSSPPLHDESQKIKQTMHKYT